MHGVAARLGFERGWWRGGVGSLRCRGAGGHGGTPDIWQGDAHYSPESGGCGLGDVGPAAAILLALLKVNLGTVASSDPDGEGGWGAEERQTQAV